VWSENTFYTQHIIIFAISPTAGVKRNRELVDKIRHQEILIEENETQCTNLFSQLESAQDDCLAL
jgi:hypothetical protein